MVLDFVEPFVSFSVAFFSSLVLSWIWMETLRERRMRILLVLSVFPLVFLLFLEVVVVVFGFVHVLR